jgi:4-phytase / acid phosphatase
MSKRNLHVEFKRLRTLLLFAAMSTMAGPGLLVASETPLSQLRYVVIITRHGVRSPTWKADRLNQYSAAPWPSWGVPPGNLTSHGRALMQIMGNYYREWFLREGLLHQDGCADAKRVSVYADRDQRTLETGRALAEALLPGCTVDIHAQTSGSKDPLFDPLETAATKPNWEIAAQAVRQRLSDPSGAFQDLHRTAFETLESVLAGEEGAPQKRIECPTEISVSVTGKGIQLNEPWSVASTLGEDLLLEYTEGMKGSDLGWGRLDAKGLLRILELHAAYADLMRRTSYLARARGSNLLYHVLQSMKQAETGKATAGALDTPGNAVLVVSGHDTNLSNLSGMLGLTWRLPGYQPDDTPPGGALVFSIWQRPRTADYFVRAQYLAQTPEQMRDTTPLTLTAPPPEDDVSIPGCGSTAVSSGCSWDVFTKVIERAIDPRFVSTEPAAQ